MPSTSRPTAASAVVTRHTATRAARCWRCLAPIAVGAEQVTATDGTHVITSHAECPRVTDAATLAARLFDQLKETP